ncbi:pyrroloquinoline quinone biosynthesis peptide chaperone PqqD [Alteromonas sp. A081]|uniref:pyrroloquinoline quinone biosynthesis peptide chaperone PqqD n=1 Tax=Alteromonas sp. A081 TaxID=3410269 RepID=UPI003B98091D
MTNLSHRIPKLNPLFRLQFEKAQASYVLLYPEGMITLNDSAAEILTRVDGQKSHSVICADLRDAFPSAPPELENDVDEFLVHAETKKWILYDA